MRKWFGAIASAAAFSALLWACGGDSSPSSSTTPSAPSTPTVSSISVTGAAPTVGATSQFAATATLSNTTTQTVTSQAAWGSSNTGVAAVSGGLVTGVSAGEADITATYQSVVGRSHVAISRAATFVVNGTVTDLTSDGVLPNINILLIDGLGNTLTTITGSGGTYAVNGVAAGLATITASAVGYVTTTNSVTVTANQRVDIVLPRTSLVQPPGGASLTCNGATVPSVVSCPNNQGIQAPTAQCNDGSFSGAQNRQGTCSSHQGVACWVCPGTLCSG